jgi:MoaA/NifB/PqqE/SkfB family radical SAM enzyme
MKLSSFWRLRRITIADFELQIHAVEHCNLNCKGCNAFSPIIKESAETYITIEAFENDCKRLSELTNGQIGTLTISGGEPLLHPRITDLLKMARNYFPKGVVRMITNGLLLCKQDEIFWELCKKHDITIIMTKYPINLDFDKIESLFSTYKIRFYYQNNTGVITKKMLKFPVDLSGSQNIKTNYAVCMFSRCIVLERGKIYTCICSAHSRYFNKYFNQNLVLTEDDYIDIYKTSDIEQVFDFLSKPIPFCKYCRPKDLVFGIDWGLSKKEISEWT